MYAHNGVFVYRAGMVAEIVVGWVKIGSKAALLTPLSF